MNATRAELLADYNNRGWTVFQYKSPTVPCNEWEKTEFDPFVSSDMAASDLPIGIVLGKVSNLAVLDIDVQNGGSVQALIDRYGASITETYSVETPSGGVHLYFEYPAGVQKLTGINNMYKRIPELKGIDFLADGRHVKAAPSERKSDPNGKPDGVYVIKSAASPQKLPKAVLDDWLAATSEGGSQALGEVTGAIPESDYSWALNQHRANVQTAEDELPGSRDNTAYQALCSSMRIASAVPDDVLSQSDVERDFLGISYEIKDFDGKTSRAIDFANQHPWRELRSQELTEEIPPGIRPEHVWDYLQSLAKARVKDAVAETLDRERIEREAAKITVTEPLNGEDFMSTKLDQPEWVVDKLLHTSGKALLSAQAKTGKTTLNMELIRALTTGTPFLGEFAVPRAMSVAYYDLELGIAQAQKWLRDFDETDYSKLTYRPLLGRGRELDMRSRSLRAATVEQLKAAEVDVLLIDPLSPIMSALGIDENRADNVRPLLDSFDELAAEAGIKAIVMTHHSGHENGGRSRGSSAFMDWPTALWNYTRSGDSFDAVRKFSAAGRDVRLPARQIVQDPATRHISIESNSGYSPDQFLLESRGHKLTAKDVATELGVDAKTARDRLTKNGWVETTEKTEGRNPATLWEYPAVDAERWTADPFQDSGS